MILWKRGPFGDRRGAGRTARRVEGRFRGFGRICGNARRQPARAGASGFPIEKKPGASFRASFRRGSSTALYLNSPIKERFPNGEQSTARSLPQGAERSGRPMFQEHRHSKFNPVDFYIPFSLPWQAFSGTRRRAVLRILPGHEATAVRAAWLPGFSGEAIRFRSSDAEMFRSGQGGFRKRRGARAAMAPLAATCRNTAPPLDTGHRYIKTYRNSQGGVQVPTGGEPRARGSPRARFQGKSADPVQIRGRR